MLPVDSLKKALKKFSEFKLENLTVEKCRQLISNIDDRFGQLEGEANELYGSAKGRLDDGDSSVLNSVRHRAGRISDEMEQLVAIRKRISDTVERNTIRKRMGDRLGGPKMLIALEVVIMVMIVIILALLLYDFTAGPDEMRPAWLSENSIFLIDVVFCVFFMGEFLLRLSCADSKRYVWKHHWIDFVTSIPLPGQAQLARFGRFGRLLRLLRLLRFARFFFLIWRGMDKFQDVMDIKLMKKTMKYALVITLVGAYLIYRLEGTLNSMTGTSAEEIGSFPLALWWSFTTVSTGGFGDIYNPGSTSGQFLTGFLVITGMVLIGVFTATLTSIFVGEQAEEIERLSEQLGDRVDEISDKIDRLANTP